MVQHFSMFFPCSAQENGLSYAKCVAQLYDRSIQSDPETVSMHIQETNRCNHQLFQRDRQMRKPLLEFCL